MNASRTQANKRLDFSAASISMQPLLVRFVTKRGPVSMRTIQKHFSGTPNDFVTAQVDAALVAGTVVIKRNGISRRAGYVYEVAE